MAVKTNFLANNSGVPQVNTPRTSSSGAASGEVAGLNGSAFLDTSIGGTGLNGASAANGDLLIGNGSGYSLNTLTPGTGINISNGSGTITISATAAPYVPTTETTNFNALINHFYSVDIATAAANVTATLPDATTLSGQTLIIQASSQDGTHHVAFASTSSQTINGNAASSLPVLVNQEQAYFFISDGSNWWTLQVLVNLAQDVTGTLPVGNGGTGRTSVTAHDLLVGNGTSALNLIAPSATSGVALVSNGSSADPSFGQLDLSSSSAVKNTLAVANGGTGQSSLTAHDVLVGNGTSGITQVSPSTSGFVLTSNGTSSDPSFQALPFTPNTLTATAGVAISAGNLVYIDSSGNIQKADNTSTAKQAIGFAPSAIGNGSSGSITLFLGTITGLTSLTVGTYYFLGTAGGLTATAPSSSGDLIQPVGFASATTILQFFAGQPIQIA